LIFRISCAVKLFIFSIDFCAKTKKSQPLSKRSESKDLRLFLLTTDY
jgi:hypothetical protein